MKDYTVQKGSVVAPEEFHITIISDGPYMVYGKPPMKQQFIMLNEDRQPWYFKAGRSFSTDKEPTAICRCGSSKNAPYCGGSHVNADWDPTLTAPEEPLLLGAVAYNGPKLILSDNEIYCAFARMCDAKGQVWNRVMMDDDESVELTKRESEHCPAGRLSAWNKETGEPYEPDLKPSLGLIEDPQIHSSGALWVFGGIPLSRQDGFTYEVRNRMTLCRCGQSANKPFCNGAHASMKWDDGLGGEPDGEEF